MGTRPPFRIAVLTALAVLVGYVVTLAPLGGIAAGRRG